MRSWGLIVLAIAFYQAGLSQEPGWRYSVSVRANYITSSKLFFNPDAPTDDLRSQYIPINDLFGGGAELRVRFIDDNWFFAISVDYISKVSNQSRLVSLGNTVRRLPGTEGIRFVPVELSLNTYIPIGSEDLRLTMGGGIGVYYAVRALSVVGVGTQMTNTPIGYGIHVGTGFEYRFMPSVSAKIEVKFRDPEIVNESRFESPSAIYEGTTILISQDAFRSKIQIDGMSFAAGVIVELF